MAVRRKRSEHVMRSASFKRVFMMSPSVNFLVSILKSMGIISLFQSAYPGVARIWESLSPPSQPVFCHFVSSPPAPSSAPSPPS